MYVIATFEQTIFLELAISALEQQGIPHGNIFAVPLDTPPAPRRIFDTIHRADGISMLDLAAVLGTIFMLLGTIYGYVLAWGPILWGIIGAGSGVVLGFLIKLWLLKKRTAAPRAAAKCASEVVLLISCEAKKWDTVEKVLWDNIALGVSRVMLPPGADIPPQKERS